MCKHFVQSSIWIGLFFSKTRYMIGVGLKKLARTPAPKFISSYPPPPSWIPVRNWLLWQTVNRLPKWTTATRSACRRGRGTLIYSYIRRLGSKFWISTFLGRFRKNKYFLGYEYFCWSHLKIGLYLRDISMHCQHRVFSWGHYTELGYFLAMLKFQIFFGVLEIPDICGGKG